MSLAGLQYLAPGGHQPRPSLRDRARAYVLGAPIGDIERLPYDEQVKLSEYLERDIECILRGEELPSIQGDPPAGGSGVRSSYAGAVQNNSAAFGAMLSRMTYCNMEEAREAQPVGT